MALDAFIKRAGEGGTGLVGIWAYGASGSIGTEVAVDTYTAANHGIPNVKDSTLTGSVEGENLILTANIQVVEDAFNTAIAALVNSVDLNTLEDKFENADTITEVENLANLKKCVVLHYLPVNNEGTAQVKLTAFVGVMSRDSNAPTTVVGERNITPIIINGISTPLSQEIPAASVNPQVATTAAAITIAANTYGKVDWVNGA